MFKFKGISNEEMDVIAEEEAVFLTKAGQRYSSTEIEGRHGALYDEEGYAPVEKSIKLQILDTNKLDLIYAWLNGVGELEYNGRITTARFYAEVEPIRVSTIKTADFTFIRNPFWEKKDDYIEVTNFVYNSGTRESEPIIRLEKTNSDSVELTINNVRFKYNFNNEPYVEIDTKQKTVLYNGLNRNRQIEMGYQFPSLLVGENRITIHSGTARIKIKRKDMWL